MKGHGRMSRFSILDTFSLLFWSALRKLLLSSPGFHPMFLNIFGSHKPRIHVMFCRQERMRSDLCRFCFGWAVIHNLYWKAGSWRLSFCSNLLPINSQTNEDIYESILSGECGNMWNLPWKKYWFKPDDQVKVFFSKLRSMIQVYEIKQAFWGI